MISNEKRATKFFEHIMNITKPCYLAKTEQQGVQQTYIVDFKKGAKFEYNGKYYSTYDTVQRSQQHLSLFQYETYISARGARLKTDEK